MIHGLLRVTNSEGRSFNVKLIRPMKPEPHESRSPWRNPTKPVVEFYDATYESDPHFGPLGQFAARYYIADLLEHPKGMDLMLYGGVPQWRLDVAAVAQVQEWLRVQSLDADEH